MYLEQFERVNRWYLKFKEINDGISQRYHSNYYKDVVYAFFQNCYHLKDWVKNDEHVNKELRNKAECFVNNSTALKICGDICNGSKHSKITDGKEKIDKDTKISRTNHILVVGSTYSAKYKIISENNEYDAFDLATQCITEWKEFLGT